MGFQGTWLAETLRLSGKIMRLYVNGKPTTLSYARMMLTLTCDAGVDGPPTLEVLLVAFNSLS
jgi:hypothetical protein